MGKSGSGKTTLLYCLSGLIKPDKGAVLCNNVSLFELDRSALSRFQRRYLGVIFQQGNLLSYYTVFDNIALPMILNKMPQRKRRKRVTYLLERIGLSGMENALPAELSTGEAQRVAAARAVAHFPELLVADEPTANLDSQNSRQLVKLLFEMSKEQQSTLIFSTHDQELLKLSDQTYQIKDGILK